MCKRGGFVYRLMRVMRVVRVVLTYIEREQYTQEKLLRPTRCIA